MLPFFLLIVAACFATDALAETTSGFMTSRDLLSSNPLSNINLQNSSNKAVNVYGLYVREFSYVAPGGTCDAATPMYSQNTTAGSFVMPTLINAGKRAVLGSNYLYNMLYDAIYFVSVATPGPPVCFLPGCTWGTDFTKYHWCIHLGALAPSANSVGYTANVPPASEVASSAGLYNYNLVNNYINLGPISCNDQTFTCTVANQQTQSFS